MTTTRRDFLGLLAGAGVLAGFADGKGKVVGEVEPEEEG
ncbi:MAG TPA: twin-arginine translocation signal domain-containing protein [Thermoanaerobaculia bacterium]|nr:twin-arginine translocation signal domain-containing protein [Thermoanaerobaculia bacterium]